MSEVIRTDPTFLRHYAGVLMREARARQGTPFGKTLVQWARRAHSAAIRSANATQPQQLDLFGATE